LLEFLNSDTTTRNTWRMAGGLFRGGGVEMCGLVYTLTISEGAKLQKATFLGATRGFRSYRG